MAATFSTQWRDAMEGVALASSGGKGRQLATLEYMNIWIFG